MSNRGENVISRYCLNNSGSMANAAPEPLGVKVEKLDLGATPKRLKGRSVRKDEHTPVLSLSGQGKSLFESAAQTPMLKTIGNDEDVESDQFASDGELDGLEKLVKQRKCAPKPKN